MKNDRAKKLIDDALAELAAALQGGCSERFRIYLRTMARFHRYSFGNILLIMTQRPAATRVAGFHAWRKLDRHVRKGEKGIAIFAPMMVHASKRDVEPDEPESRTARVLRFRIVYVFDIAQTDGAPLPSPSSVAGDPGEALSRLMDLVAERGIALERGTLPPGVDGVSSGGCIRVRADLSPAQAFSVTAHELAHELLHQSMTPDERPSKTVRETEAEAVAFVACAAIGLETDTAASDYILSYAGNADTLAASLDRIQRVAAVIIEAVTPVATEAHA